LPISVYYVAEGKPTLGEPAVLVEVIRKHGGEWLHEPHAGYLRDGPCASRPCERCREGLD